MNYSSATGLSAHQMVALIMSAKSLDVIVGQPTTESMGRMAEQMAQMVAPVKTIAWWGGLHGSLTLVLDDVDYATVTKNIVTSAALLSKPTEAMLSKENGAHMRECPIKLLLATSPCALLEPLVAE
jgi:hypothetical protein